MLKKIFTVFKIKKEPTFLEKVDKWQTEMYLYKLEQERKALK
jgi:hypothetical protein